MAQKQGMTQLIRFYSNLILSLIFLRPNVQTLTNKTEDSKKAESSNNRIERL